MKHYLRFLNLGFCLLAVFHGSGTNNQLRYSESSEPLFINGIQLPPADYLLEQETGEDESLTLTIQTSEGGELFDLIGSDLRKVTELVVSGPLNYADFAIMDWAATYGRLSKIDLRETAPENGAIPESAFSHFWGDANSHSQLREIVLPLNLVAIQTEAFAHCKFNNIIMPETLNYIGPYAFQMASIEQEAPFVLPEGLETIYNNAFDYFWVSGEIVLPNTVKYIYDQAFLGSNLTEINLPEGLDYIGDLAFFDCELLKEITIPSTCRYVGDSAFNQCPKIESLKINCQLVEIPDYFADLSPLESLELPSSVRKIGKMAFSMLQATSLNLNEGLEVIGDRAFQLADKLETVSFPSTLKEIGQQACQKWESIVDVYCSAIIPPVCHDNTFGAVDMGKVTLWVPVGCAEEYRQAVGWTNFINIIETSQFPTAGIQFTVIDDNSNNGDLYDLMGRKVSNPQPGTIYFRDGNKFIYH